MPERELEIAAQLDSVVAMFADRRAVNETGLGERSPWARLCSLDWDEEPPSADDLRARHEARVEEFFAAHLKPMTALGLEVVAGPAGVLAAEAGVQRPNVLVFELADPARAIGFFRSLREVMITDERREALTEVVRDLAVELAGLATSPEPPVDTLYAARQLLKEFQRLGLGETDRLALYIDELARGTLREYFVAESVLSRTKFGPDRWHTDSSPEHYEEEWGNLLANLEFLGRNPQAREKYRAVLGFLEAAAESAYSDLEERRERQARPNPPADSAFRPEYLETLTRVRGEIAVRRENLE